MVFILGVNFPENRLVKQALEQFYGIGPNVSARLMAKLHLHAAMRVRSLQNKQVLDLTAELTNMKIENDLKREMRENIARLRDMKTRRGLRHALGLPVRGQKTQTQTATSRRLNRVDRKG